MMRPALLLASLVLMLAVGAFTASAARSDNGTDLANRVVKIIQTESSIVTGTKGGCAKIGAALKKFNKAHGGEFASLTAKVKHMSQGDQASFAQQFVSQGASLVAKIETGIAGHVEKPFSEGSLVGALRRALGHGDESRRCALVLVDRLVREGRSEREIVDELDRSLGLRPVYGGSSLWELVDRLRRRR